MELTDVQADALIELITIGFGRAASSLSKLTGYRVVLDRPSIDICPAADLDNVLDGFNDDVASVHQIFSGPVGGDAVLVLDRHAAMLLKQLLTDEPALPLASDRTAHEVLTEVGNILLNACLGTLGNVLDVRVTFAVPRLTLATLATLINSLTVGQEGVRYALVVQAAFRLRESAIRGYLVIVLSVASLDRLVSTVGEWEARVR